MIRHNWLPGLLIAVIIGCFILAVAGCSSPPSSGYVSGKNFIPAHSDYTPGYWVAGTCYGSGRNRYCTQGHMDPGYSTYYGDEWQLNLCSESPGSSGSDNKCGWRDVDQHEYNTYKLGSFYNAGQ